MNTLDKDFESYLPFEGAFTVSNRKTGTHKNY